jgi:HK97 family phage portal protein
MTPTEFKRNQILSILIDGNRYSEIKRNKKGEIIELIPISAERVKKDHDRAEKGMILYKVSSSTGKIQTIKFEDMFKGIGMSQDGINGLSPIAMHRETIGHAIVAAEHGAKVLAKGGLPSVALIGDIKDKNHRDKVRTEFNDRYAKGGGGCAILPSTWSIESMKVSNEDMQYLDSRKFQRAEIAGGIFGVPLHFLGDLEKATLNNVEQQSLEFVMYCLMPYLISYEESINRDLLTESERETYFAKFNVSGFMRGDSESRANYYDKMLKNGVYSINEVRKMEEMNKIDHESADGHYKQVNEANITKNGRNYEEDRNNDKKQRRVN